MITLRVFDNKGKTIDRYTIIIDKDVYRMSYHANMPNGCNYYVGSFVYVSPGILIDEVKDIQSLPEGVRIGITDRLLSKSYHLSIFEIFKLLGIETDNHESDLYVKVTPESKFIIDQYEFKSHVTKFIYKDELWFDILFEFDPFWDKKRNIK